MAARKKKRMSAQVVEDEDYQLHYEKVAGIDVTKESAAVCVRLPPAEGKAHRNQRAIQGEDTLTGYRLGCLLGGLAVDQGPGRADRDSTSS